MRIFLLPLLLIPFLELSLMIVIGDEIGAFAVILWVIAMVFVGANLLRHLGASGMLKVAQSMRAGQLPAATIAESLVKALGAVLLIIPGFITDALALLCFIPVFRRLLFKRWTGKMGIHAAGFSQGRSPFNDSPVDRGAGNIYEHDGPGSTEHPSLLIDAEKDSKNSSTSGSAKNS